MRRYLTALCLLAAIYVHSQTGSRPLTKRIIIKTNVLSLLAQQPTFSAEKVFSKTFSTEFSFVQGRLHNLLFTDHYRYNGFLLRAKKYFTAVGFGIVSWYGGAYFGNLERTIQTEGRALGSTGYLSYMSRNFKGSSLRGGATLGIAYFSKSRILIDGQTSLGYGTYYKTKGDKNGNGYPDFQTWLSIGYCF